MSARLLTLAALIAAGPAVADSAKPRAGDILMGEIQKCWNPPVPASGRRVIAVRFELNRDGSLAGEPVIQHAEPADTPENARQAALRAVRRCTPIALPQDSYEDWREVVINFDDALLARPPAASASPQ